jgi:hypothetical protein
MAILEERLNRRRLGSRERTQVLKSDQTIRVVAQLYKFLALLTDKLFDS